MTDNITINKVSTGPAIILLVLVAVLAMLTSGPTYTDKEMMAYSMSQEWAKEQIPAGLEIVDYEILSIETGTTDMTANTYFVEALVNVENPETGERLTTAYTATIYQKSDSETMWYMDDIYMHKPEF
jgi:hypothetical protein